MSTRSPWCALDAHSLTVQNESNGVNEQASLYLPNMMNPDKRMLSARAHHKMTGYTCMGFFYTSRVSDCRAGSFAAPSEY